MNPLVFIPTYNEIANVEELFYSIRSLELNIDILFLDDNSPDGTGGAIDNLVKSHSHTFVLHRTAKSGVGSAHQDGISWAFSQGYLDVITMDCDFTHSPKYLQKLIDESPGCDIVVGSRFIDPSSLDNWSKTRIATTHLANVLTNILLNLPYDSTSGFRLYRLNKDMVDTINQVGSKSYSFFFESLYLLNLKGFTIREIPVQLASRTQGNSKMSIKDIFQSFKTIVNLYLCR